MTSELPGAAAAGRYVPILKAKEGEYKALADLRPDVKVAISPILEVPPIPWDYASDAPAKGLDAHIAPVIPKVAAAWGAGQVAYLDAGLVADERTAVGAHPVQALFGEARAAGLSLVPVSRIDGSADDLAAVAGVVVADGRGMCLRLVPDDFLAGASLGAEIARVLAATGTDAAGVDLVIDLGPCRRARRRPSRSPGRRFCRPCPDSSTGGRLRSPAPPSRSRSLGCPRWRSRRSSARSG